MVNMLGSVRPADFGTFNVGIIRPADLEFDPLESGFMARDDNNRGMVEGADAWKRGNQPIHEIQLPFDDCAYQYGSGFPLGILILLFDYWYPKCGQGMDRVYSVALCRGDINQDVCLRCLSDIIVEIQFRCPNNIYVSAIYETCLLTYNNDTLMGKTKMDSRGYVNVGPNSTNIVSFHAALRPLLDKLRADASNGGPLMKFATGNTMGPDFTNIYALMQCTPDLSKRDCNVCLEDLSRNIPSFIGGKLRGRIVGSVCNLRYDERLFYNESRPLVTSPPSSSSPSPSSPHGMIFLSKSCYVVLLLVMN
ncbi:cysteine-rich receptor-like protein kinase 26 [Tanacetum coccineum]